MRVVSGQHGIGPISFARADILRHRALRRHSDFATLCAAGSFTGGVRGIPAFRAKYPDGSRLRPASHHWRKELGLRLGLHGLRDNAALNI
jgi:hypothetical protein